MHLSLLHFFHGLIAHFFLVLNAILLSGYTTVYLSIHLLGCFQVLAVMNKAAVICVCRLLCGHKFLTPLDEYQEVQLVDHMVRSCLVL